MNRFSIATVAAMAGALTLIAGPGFAETTPHQTVHRQTTRCEARRRHVANNGTVIGAVGGGLIGNRIGGGGLGGTLIGAGAGAVVGHHVAAHSHPCPSVNARAR